MSGPAAAGMMVPVDRRGSIPRRGSLGTPRLPRKDTPDVRLNRLFLLAVLGAALALGAGTALAAITGTDGNDTLRGTAGSDVIDGRAGGETITGFCGNDLLLGEFFDGSQDPALDGPYRV